jgi:hypothetical protein
MGASKRLLLVLGRSLILLYQNQLAVNVRTSIARRHALRNHHRNMTQCAVRCANENGHPLKNARGDLPCGVELVAEGGVDVRLQLVAILYAKVEHRSL